MALLSKPATQKYGLTIGIGYTGTGNDLPGTQNSARRIKNLWTQQLQIPDSNIKVLIDDGQNENPDFANIQAGISWLMSKAGPGVQLLMNVASHGMQLPDPYGDTPGGQVYGHPPADYFSTGRAIDGKMYADWLEPGIRAGATIWVVGGQAFFV